jgi:hypothetical protein
MRKHRVNDDGMTLRKNPACTLHEDFVNFPDHLRLVCALGQPIRFIDPELLLSQDVRARYDSSRLRLDARGKGARQYRFSGSGQAANSDEFRRRRAYQSVRKLEIVRPSLATTSGYPVVRV